jgi:hypothetical protein
MMRSSRVSPTARKYLIMAVLFAVALLVVSDFASRSWPFALPASPGPPVAPRAQGPRIERGADSESVVYSWRGILMQPVNPVMATLRHHPSRAGMLVEQIEAGSPVATTDRHDPGDADRLSHRGTTEPVPRMPGCSAVERSANGRSGFPDRQQT